MSPWLAARRHHRAAVNFCGTRIHNGTSSQNASAIPCRHNRAASMHWQSGGTPCCLTVQVDAPASKTEWGVAVPPLLRKAVFASVGTGGCFGRVDWVVGPRRLTEHLCFVLYFVRYHMHNQLSFNVAGAVVQNPGLEIFISGSHYFYITECIWADPRHTVVCATQRAF